MTAIITTLNSWSAGWTTLVVSILWQSTLLAVVVALISVALRSSSPAVRYWLWQIVAIKLLLMPLWSWPAWSVSVPLPWPATPTNVEPVIGVIPADVVEIRPPAAPMAPIASLEPQTSPADVVDKASNGRSSVHLTWRSWLLAGWFAIVLLQLARLIQQRSRLARLLRSAAPADGGIAEIVRELAQLLKLKRAPATKLTTDDCSPFVCRIVSPTLVLPRTLTASLAPAELQQVIAHELAHVKRRDLIWSWIPEIARMVYFFHPVAHWVAWRVRLERELACDQWAIIASGNSPGEYAQTLLRVVSHVSQPAALRTAIAPLVGEESGKKLEG